MSLEFFEQLAFDEAMLELNPQVGTQAIRFWMPSQVGVVLGRSSPVSSEVNEDACRDSAILARRVSGGQTIVTGPGCMMYAVAIQYADHPELRMLDQAHAFVMGAMARAIQGLGIPVQIDGTSDLTLGGRKFSGNSLRCKRDAFVYHGTIICEDFDLSLVSKCLDRPIREPDYREGRSHQDFLTRLPVDCETLQAAIVDQWRADQVMPESQQNALCVAAKALAKSKYATDEWIYKVP